MHSKATVSALGQDIKNLKIDKRLDMNGKQLESCLLQGIHSSFCTDPPYLCHIQKHTIDKDVLSTS